MSGKDLSEVKTIRRKRMMTWLLEFSISVGVILFIKIITVKLSDSTNKTNVPDLLFEYISEGDLACVVVVSTFVLIVGSVKNVEGWGQLCFGLCVVVMIVSTLIVGATGLEVSNKSLIVSLSIFFAIAGMLVGTMLLYFYDSGRKR